MSLLPKRLKTPSSHDLFLAEALMRGGSEKEHERVADWLWQKALQKEKSEQRKRKPA